MMEKFDGIFPALVTAYGADGEIDIDVQKRVTRWQYEQGCRGFFVCGGTGEGVLLTAEERMAVLQAVVDEVGGEATIIAHVGATSPLEAYRLADHAASLDVDAIAAIPGSYFKPDTPQLIAHYRELAAIAGRPTMLYHIPTMTGVSLDLDIIARLREILHVQGLKFTDYNLFLMQGMREQEGDDFIILSGADEMMVPSRLMGANGAIGSWYNLIPGIFIDACDVARAGDWAKAADYQRKANQIITRWLPAGCLGLIKFGLEELGFPVGPARRPLPEIDAATRREFIADMQASGLL